MKSWQIGLVVVGVVSLSLGSGIFLTIPWETTTGECKLTEPTGIAVENCGTFSPIPVWKVTLSAQAEKKSGPGLALICSWEMWKLFGSEFGARGHVCDLPAANVEQKARGSPRAFSLPYPHPPPWLSHLPADVFVPNRIISIVRTK